MIDTRTRLWVQEGGDEDGDEDHNDDHEDDRDVDMDSDHDDEGDEEDESDSDSGNGSGGRDALETGTTSHEQENPASRTVPQNGFAQSSTLPNVDNIHHRVPTSTWWCAMKI